MPNISEILPGSSRPPLVQDGPTRERPLPLLTGVSNGPGAVPPVRHPLQAPATGALSDTESALKCDILASGAPEAERVAALLCSALAEAADPFERARLVSLFADALAARRQPGAALAGFGLNTLHMALDRVGWSTLTHAMPSVAVLAACAQFTRNASWSQVAAALPALAALLPSLRHYAQVEQLVQTLPVALRDSLAGLHDWVDQADAALVPRLYVAPATALAVTALLWHLQEKLPRPQAPPQGLVGFIATLPSHWQRLAGLCRAGSALFAPVAAWPAPRQITYLPPADAAVAPGPCLPVEAATPPDRDRGVTSAATRLGDRGLIAAAAGLVLGGVGFILQGRWMLQSGTPEPEPQPDPDAATWIPPHVEATIRMLDDIRDFRGSGTVWQALREGVRGNATGPDGSVAGWVQVQLLANEVAAEVATHEAEEGHGSPARPPGLRARRAAGTQPPSLPQAALETASRELAEAALALPAGPVDPEDLISGSDDRIALDQARVHLRQWTNHLRSAGQAPDTTLMTALRRLGTSDVRLALVADWLPRLDGYIAAVLVENIKGITGNAVDPAAIYRATFAKSSPWPEWESGLRRPDRRQFPRYRGFPTTDRVYETMISQHTLVEAAVMAPETDATHTVLQTNGTARDCFPADRCTTVDLAQYNRANAGQDHIGEFRKQFDAFMASCRRPGPQPEREAYADAMQQRLAGAGTLLTAMGHLGGAGKWLLDVLLQHPTRFSPGPGQLGRALAMPGQDIQVARLVARPGEGADVPLQGVLLATSAPSIERPRGAVLLIAPALLPLVQEFASTADALQKVDHELPQKLHTWVAAEHHARWRDGNGRVQRGPMVDGHLLHELFFHQLSLRSSQLGHAATGPRNAAQARKDYLALDQRLLALPSAVPLSMLVAAHERLDPTLVDLYSAAGAQWVAQTGLPPVDVLRHVDVEGARWLSSLGTRHSLVKGAYPLASRFVAAQLEASILSAHGVAIDAEAWFLVQFSGGTPSSASFSGFVHDSQQKVAACPLVECALTRAKAYPDGRPGSATLGIYSDTAAQTFDAGTELADLLPGQLVTVMRGLDLRSSYLDALNGFWSQHRPDVLACVRGVYMSSAWQQFGEGSLSVQGLQVAMAATGFLMLRQAEDPTFKAHMDEDAHVSWVSLYGARSMLMRIANAAYPEVLLYSPGDRVAFREFADGAQFDAWMTRVVGNEQGRAWLNASFDLADLQDGWFSNGVGNAVEHARAELFQGDPATLVILGDDLFEALVSRLQVHTLRDAGTLFSSNWEIWRDQLQHVLHDVDLALGIASLFFPVLLPVVSVVASAEAVLGVQQAIDGRTEAERRQGGVDAGLGLLGVALSAPFAMAREAARATTEWGRATGAIQASADAGAADPLRALSARYAQPASLVVDGARPADNGVYHYLGRHYIRQSGSTYEVVMDKANRTWRLKNPSPANLYQDPVRLNAEGLWEPHSDVGLRGGAPNAGSGVSRSVPMGSTYRGALEAEVRQMRGTSPGSASADFRWGMLHPERVVMPEPLRGAATLEQMKGMFVSGRLEQVQRGALSTIIARVERSMRLETVVRMEEEVFEAVNFNGGYLYTVSQALLDTRDGRGMGWCTGLSRVMAVAIAQHRELELVGNLRLALRLPDEGLGAELLSHVYDAQGIALLPGAVSAQSRIGFDELGRFVGGLRQEGVFIVTGSQHSMVLAKQRGVDGRWMHLLYDPNLGLMQFRNAAKFDRWLRQLFSSRYFSSLQRASSGQHGETLAEMYGAARPGVLAPPSLFMIRQVDTAKFLQQARQRGWTRLLEQVPA